MNGIMMGRDDKSVDFLGLGQVPVPDETRTYKPIPHDVLASKIIEISTDILTDYALVGENYVLARKGQQLFAMLNFQHPDVDDKALSIAFRSSYDKSMSLIPARRASSSRKSNSA